LYRLARVTSLLDINRYVRNNEGLKQSLLEIRKELNGELENPLNKIFGALEFTTYIHFFMERIFSLLYSNPEYRVKPIDYEELSKKVIATYRQYQ
jgi:hypothetical protein